MKDAKVYRRYADLTLAAVFIIFIISMILNRYYPGDIYAKGFFAVMEAALVGGVADWFAVTAIFKKPLGFPFHTALIPRNRDKLASSLAAAVENELFSKEAIKERLETIAFVKIIKEALSTDARRESLSKSIAAFIIKAIDIGALASFINSLVKKYLKDAPLDAKITEITNWANALGAFDALIDFFLAEISKVTTSPDFNLFLYNYLESLKQAAANEWWQQAALNLGEMTGAINTVDAAEALILEINSLIDELKDARSPFRERLKNELINIFTGQKNAPYIAEQIKVWQNRDLAALDFKEFFAALLGVSVNGLTLEKAASLVDAMIKNAALALTEDSFLAGWLDEKIKEALSDLINTAHQLTAQVVTDAFNNLSVDELNDFVEAKAGKDLARIRISGSVVGAAIGLILFWAAEIFAG